MVWTIILQDPGSTTKVCGLKVQVVGFEPKYVRHTGCFLRFHFQNDQVLTNFLALDPFNEGPVSKTPFMQIPFKY